MSESAGRGEMAARIRHQPKSLDCVQRLIASSDDTRRTDVETFAIQFHFARGSRSLLFRVRTVYVLLRNGKSPTVYLPESDYRNRWH